MIKLCLVSKHKWIKKFVNFIIMEIAQEEKMTFEIYWNKNELKIKMSIQFSSSSSQVLNQFKLSFKSV